MLGTFLGLETAFRGLMTQQNAIDTASHNISNANTEGYSRQRVDMTASQALEVPGLMSTNPGQIGTGVQVEDITRLRDQFLDGQYQNQNQNLGQAQVQQDTLQKVTGIINEPSDTGISASLQNLWNAWDQLGSNPASLSARTEVQQTGITFAQTLNQTASQLVSLQTNVQSNLSSRVTQVNAMLGNIASLNQQIASIQAMGKQPNDLMDQRDETVDQLSQLSNVTIANQPNGYQVSIGGNVVVSGTQVGQVGVASGSNPPTLQTTHFNTTTQVFDTTVSADALTAPGGALQGTLDSIGYISSYQNDLDTIAQSLAGTATQGKMNVKLPGTWSIVGPSGGGTPTFPVGGTFADGTSFNKGDAVSLYPNEGITTSTNSSGNMVASVPAGATVTVNGLNGLQQIGFSEVGPGQDFFVPSVPGQPISAANISVQLSATQIAAGTSAEDSAGAMVALPGDGTLAIAMSSVKDAPSTFTDPSAPTQTMTGTVNDYLQAVVGQLGIQGQKANNDVTNQQSLVQQLSNQRQSVSGVSIDEEMTNIIKYQQAYNASAKMVSTVNDMLTTLIQSV